ncbi:fimbrial biogenesis outer membrane usher protein [Mesorhizobium sp. M00.F.Ca.ET.186.01.1.1]|nr:fimbrial biogenesis outer membrane usher protein [bacterium M00.F.Ca.ET.205.01.1.1]TGU55625.1 fimbrial biogenesis outer membrane usher protein [bacterium M00.F.Ca.ET.152.01.1.1]TGV40098.1 fimbrial biogenesis outer membrane usher protein [Mesorhizobium sp. M00.F.Ca.ET.186.01.1.1]TGZ45083.1 fimbrial biogenesis outer membrane usher protein [bacterium M00.F.Ca.ET.162.01.1.1]
MNSACFLTLSILVVALTQSCQAAGAVQQLQLEVFINGAATNQIAAFVSPDGQHLGATPDELQALGLDLSKLARSAGTTVMLDTVRGLAYRYEAPEQRVFLTINNGLRGTISFDASPAHEAAPDVREGFGGVLNYNLFAALQQEPDVSGFTFNGVSTTLDARAFSPLGTFGQSAILRLADDGRTDALRLDTAYTYSDPATLMTYQAGDAISGGFAWTRPIRIGGLQARRNFGLRTDLITQPLASVSGSAAVPSTVDVYVNDLKTYSHTVDGGPFQITDIPVTAGGGQAIVVLRDAAGRETRTSVPFYASPSLLRPGLLDFSLEAGLPRLGYATMSDAYAVNQPVISASLRKGIYDWLTLESHAEAGKDLLNGGLGMVMRTGSLGVASFALAGSHSGAGSGLQSYASYEIRIGRLSINASSQMTFGSYDDLASVTGRLQDDAPGEAFFNLLSVDPDAADARSGPPRMVNSISAGIPLSFDSGSISASYIDLLPASGERSRVLTASYSRTLPFGYLNATAFADLGGRRTAGLFAGLSIPIGGSAMASTAVSAGKHGVEMIADVSKPLGEEPGSVGWRTSFSQGGSTEGSAAVSYRSSHGRADAAVGRSISGTTATAQFDGALATMGSDIFLADRIDDSFAVVETGLPDVGVLYENRPIGTTDAKGRLLVPGLRAYQRNKIAIDTTNLPIDADVTTTQDVIAPADRAGVRVNFQVRTNIDAAVLVLSDPDGQPLEVGSHATVNGKQGFVIGYDGRAYVKGLAQRNTVVAQTAKGSCQASFGYTPKANQQVVVPVVCR